MDTATLMQDIPQRTARNAFQWVSQDPDSRGDRAISDYVQTLTQDWTTLAAICTNGKSSLLPTLEVEFERYRQGYRKRYLAYLYSSSRCASTFITGASNFPARRMEKRGNIAHKRLTEFLDFRTHALRAINRILHPERAPIMAGDADATGRLAAKIAEAETLQSHMKAVNDAHKRFLKEPTSLDAAPFSEAIKARIRNYRPAYSWEPHPFAPYELTNNNANLRRMKSRIVGIVHARSLPDSSMAGEHATLEDCPAENRVRLTFPGKPSEEVRTQLKRSGFRWTPSLGVWQAYRHTHTIALAKQFAGCTM